MSYSTLVIAPGRGSYQRSELGYLQQHLAQVPNGQGLLTELDAARASLGLTLVSELDGASQFISKQYQQADNAAALILACGLMDYRALAQSDFQPVAMTGNSMGWYTALSCAGVWQPQQAMVHASNMARWTAVSKKGQDSGGQLIYPLVDEQWQPCAEYQQRVNQLLQAHAGELAMSIAYGGYAVLAGSSWAIAAAQQALPMIDERFPLVLPGHSAFHSDFMNDASAQALANIGVEQFALPRLPLIDGCGEVWQPYSTDLAKLRDYTLLRQVTQQYDFSLAVQVAVKEFCPERIVLLGPGNGLAGAVVQSLIALGWQGLTSKQDFLAQQREQPWLIAMATPEQRQLLQPKVMAE